MGTYKRVARRRPVGHVGVALMALALLVAACQPADDVAEPAPDAEPTPDPELTPDAPTPEAEPTPDEPDVEPTPDELVTVEMGLTGASEGEWPLRIAMSHGLLEERGIQVEDVPFADFGAAHTAMRAGEIDGTIAGIASIVQLRDQGEPVLVAHGTHVYANDVLVREDSDIEDIGDLVGRDIGVFGGPGSTSANMFLGVARAYYGFDPMTEATVQFGAPPLLGGLLREGEIDAFLSLGLVTIGMLTEGGVRSIGETGEIYADNTGDTPVVAGILYREEFTDEHPEAATALVDAWLAGYEILRTDDDALAEVAALVDITDEQAVELIRERYFAHPRFVTTWDEGDIDEQLRQLEFLQEHGEPGFLEGIPEDTFTLEFVPE